MLAAGRIELIDETGVSAHSDVASPTPWSIERALARRIGPYAAIVVRNGLRDGAGVVRGLLLIATETHNGDPN